MKVLSELSREIRKSSDEICRNNLQLEMLTQTSIKLIQELSKLRAEIARLTEVLSQRSDL